MATLFFTMDPSLFPLQALCQLPMMPVATFQFPICNTLTHSIRFILNAYCRTAARNFVIIGSTLWVALLPSLVLMLVYSPAEKQWGFILATRISLYFLPTPLLLAGR